MPRIRSTDEVTECSVLSRAAAREAARQRQRDAEPDGGRGEVVPGQPGHLGQVAHRRLAAVPLPVGVGREADGGVERPSAVDTAPRCCGLNGRNACKRCKRVGDEDAEQAERQQVNRVRPQLCVSSAPHAAEAQEQPLDGAEHARERSALAPRTRGACRRRAAWSAPGRPGRRRRICSQPLKVMGSSEADVRNVPGGAARRRGRRSAPARRRRPSSVIEGHGRPPQSRSQAWV